jgi:hypothetical protein
MYIKWGNLLGVCVATIVFRQGTASALPLTAGNSIKASAAEGLAFEFSRRLFRTVNAPALYRLAAAAVYTRMFNL